MRRATPESPRMFKSDLIDFFSRVPFWVVPVIYVPIVIALLAVSLGVYEVPIVLTAVQFAVGLLVWTLTEYWLHRTIFHWVPDKPWGPRLHFLLHGVHHEWFQDRLRLVMPPVASLGLGVAFFGLYWSIGQLSAAVMEPSWVFAFYAGKVTGYMNYDLTHYYIHHGRPTLTLYKKLRAHHNAHHHNRLYKDRKYGVSTTLWDHVFRTY